MLLAAFGLRATKSPVVVVLMVVGKLCRGHNLPKALGLSLNTLPVEPGVLQPCARARKHSYGGLGNTSGKGKANVFNHLPWKHEEKLFGGNLWVFPGKLRGFF